MQPILNTDVVINFHGDEPFIKHTMLEQLIVPHAICEFPDMIMRA